MHQERKRVGRPKGEPTRVVRLPVPIASLAARIASRTPLRFGEIVAFLDVEARAPTAVVFVTSTVPAGFPSPADDYLDNPLDFNELLIQNPAATFAVRVGGDSMVGAGIYPDDIAIVNRSRSPVDRCIILALVDGGFTLKRYRTRGGRIWLQAENPAYGDTEITEDLSFEVWGVVTNSIRML